MNAPMKQWRRAGRIFKDFVMLAILGVLGIGALSGALWLEHSIEIMPPTKTSLLSFT